MHCPLCSSEYSDFFHRDRRREYLRCQRCGLVFVDAKYWLSPEQEKAEYDSHQNSPDDLGYRKFLSRLVSPLQGLLEPGDKGLDFGCGPGPTLSVMMAEQGWDMSVFDIFYYPDADVLNERYDFITATEVIEHLCNPAQVLNSLWRQLNEQGCLALMTKLVIDQEAFAQWHYKNDPTHICFYSVQTFTYLAQCWSAQLIQIDKDVIFIKKGVGKVNDKIKNNAVV